MGGTLTDWWLAEGPCATRWGACENHGMLPAPCQPTKSELGVGEHVDFLEALWAARLGSLNT